jgi:hypothetical protein
MATFVILSRIAPQGVKDPKDLKGLAKTVADKIKQQLAGILQGYSGHSAP